MTDKFETFLSHTTCVSFICAFRCVLHILLCGLMITLTVFDCILYLMQYLYDPNILLSSANWCILRNVYLRSDLSRERGVKLSRVSLRQTSNKMRHFTWLCRSVRPSDRESDI